jgi:hypothetical protein
LVVVRFTKAPFDGVLLVVAGDGSNVERGRVSSCEALGWKGLGNSE